MTRPVRRFAATVVAALPGEVARLIRRKDLRSITGSAEPRPIPGTACGLLLTGVGGPRTARALEGIPPEVLGRAVVAGFAGGLDPLLRPGDVLLAREVVDARDETAGPLLLPDPGLVELVRRAAPRRLRLREGRIVSTAAVAGAPAEKDRLRSVSAADAVDMESASALRSLARAGVPAVCVRAVVDEASRHLPPEAPRLLDPAGRPRPRAALAGVLRRPALAGDLAALGRRSRRAARALGALLRPLLAALAAAGATGTDREAPYRGS